MSPNIQTELTDKNVDTLSLQGKGDNLVQTSASTKKMNVGIVTTWFERGAAYVSRQYMNLLKKKNNVFIYARGGEKYARGNKYWDLPNVTWGRKAFFQANGSPIHKSDFTKWIAKNKINLILFNEQQWWPPVLWAKDAGVRTGAYVDYYTEETVPLYEAFDFLICNTMRHYSVFDWHKNCFYVPWGTDVNIFKPQVKRQNRDKIVFFNSLGYNPDRKGVYPLLKAFHRLKGNDRKLILHTQVDLKEHYRDLAPVVHELKEKGLLEIITETVGAPGLYHLADVYCYVSKLDGIGLTLPEAISCGLQAIVPDNAPMNEFVQDGVNGRLVRIEKTYTRQDGYYWPCCEVDVEDLVSKMQYYLDNRNIIDNLKQASRQYAVKNLNWDEREERFTKIFNSVSRTEIDDDMRNRLYEYERSRIWEKLSILPYYLYRNITR